MSEEENKQTQQDRIDCVQRMQEWLAAMPTIGSNAEDAMFEASEHAIDDLLENDLGRCEQCGMCRPISELSEGQEDELHRCMQGCSSPTPTKAEEMLVVMLELWRPVLEDADRDPRIAEIRAGRVPRDHDEMFGCREVAALFRA